MKNNSCEIRTVQSNRCATQMHYFLRYVVRLLQLLYNWSECCALNTTESHELSRVGWFTVRQSDWAHNTRSIMRSMVRLLVRLEIYRLLWHFLCEWNGRCNLRNSKQQQALKWIVMLKHDANTWGKSCQIKANQSCNSRKTLRDYLIHGVQQSHGRKTDA